MAKKKKATSGYDSVTENGVKEKSSRAQENLNVLRQAVDNWKRQHPDEMKKLMELLNNPKSEPRKDRFSKKLYEVDEVSAADWSLTHPMVIVCGGDKFYADLANELQSVIIDMPLPPDLPNGFIKETAMSISAYLEDLVSDIGIWNNLRLMYKNFYGKPLPFYDCSHDDYYEDDLNIEDIKVLVWQAFNRCGQPEGRVFSPYSMGVEQIAERTYNLLIDKFDKAPQAIRVRDAVRKVLRDHDYFMLRALGYWLNINNKLTAMPGWHLAMDKEIKEIKDGYKDLLDDKKAAYEVEARHGWESAMSMLGCPTSRMLESLARSYGATAAADLLATIFPLPLVRYKLVRWEDKNMVLCDCSGEEFKVSYKSMGTGFDRTGIKGALLSLVKFGDVWYQNGVATYIPVDFDWHTNSLTDMVVGGYDKVMQKMREVIRKNNGRRVFYCKDTQAVVDIVKVLEPKHMDEEAETDDKPDNLLLMISENVLPVVVPDVCQIFSDRTNPFYDSYVDRDEIGIESRDFITQGVIPDDVAAYIQEKRLLPHAFIKASQGKRVGKAIVQDNLRFLAGFYRVRSPKYD